MDAPPDNGKATDAKPARPTRSALLWERARRGVALMTSQGRAHRGWFVRGALFAVLLVAIRVAMPWPLQALIKPWLSSGEGAVGTMPGWELVAAVGLVYAALVTLLGFADYRLRLNFARFAIGVVRDVRAAVIRGIRRIRHREGDHTTGDLVTRLIGDSARLKAGMKGFLVHVATNGLLFVGISAVMLWMDWRIGLIFLSASLLAVAVTTAGAVRIFRSSLKFRRKETKIANTIAARLALHADEDDEDDDGLDDESLGANRSSGRHEATITRMQGLTTWSAHLILAVALPAAFWFSYRAVSEKSMDPGELFVVMLYALMILGPMVRLTRQGARSGKILANADRLADLLEATKAASAGDGVRCGALREGLALEEVRLRTRVKGGKRRWFGPTTFRIAAGEKVALLGAPGTGKSTLLAIMGGRETYKGSVRWDHAELRDLDAAVLGEHIAQVAQVPNWPSLESSGLLNAVAEGGPAAELLRRGKLRALRSRLATVADGRILPEEVSHSERKVLALMRCVDSAHSLKLVDDPVSDMAVKRSARRYLTAFMEAQAPGQTVVVALDRPMVLGCFDRVIELKKKGRIAFSGSPEEWQRWKEGSDPPPADGADGQEGHIAS